MMNSRSLSCFRTLKKPTSCSQGLVFSFPFYELTIDNRPQIVDSSAEWRNSWATVLANQTRLTKEFENIFTPLNNRLHPPDCAGVGTVVAQCNKLQTEAQDLQSDMLQELETVDALMIKPAVQAREEMQHMRRTIKKRNEVKV